MNAAVIRRAVPEDAAALLAIYAPYIEKTAITFEYDVPALSEFRTRIENTLRRYPYLVAEEGGRPVGYAYLSAFHPRAAYQWCAETSIYLAMDTRGRGIGSRLYEALEDAARSMGILNLNACIAVADPEDEYLTNASPRFHEKRGYAMVGKFHSCGYKFGRWYGMVWMEKMLGAHTASPAPVQAFR